MEKYQGCKKDFLQNISLLIFVFLRWSSLEPRTDFRSGTERQQNALKSMDNFARSSTTHRITFSASSHINPIHYNSSGPGSDPSDVRANSVFDRPHPPVSQNTCNSNNMATGCGSESSSSNFQYSQREEGYDLEFVHPKDEKYDCPICLLVLREPVQTPCGHRFCKYCIIKWLRESETEARCPVDNATLGEGQLFPDNFAKREILALIVKCPNFKEGCTTEVILKQLENHLDVCDYVCVPCPNKCSHILLSKDLSNHLQNDCNKRTVQCSMCHSEYLAEELQEHEERCPLASLSCSFCGYDLIREQLNRHLDHDCPKAVIDCQFAELGCETRVERNDMAQHMQTSIQDHMQLMRRAIVRICQTLKIDRSSILTSNGVDDRGTEVSAGEMNSIVSMLTHLNVGLSDGAVGGAIGGASSHQTASQNSDNDVCGGRPYSQDIPQFPRRREEDGTLSNATQEATKYSYTSQNNSGTDLECLQQIVSLKGLDSLMNRNNAQDESLARHEHLLAELKHKNESLERRNNDLRSKLRNAESVLNEFEGRTCNGMYVWKIKSYSKFRREAEHGDTTAIHSPAFYSSFYGYKLCIRVNLNGVDTARGSHLSVFVHFMQGDYDDILEWPFSGRIILTVVDQNPNCEMRNHVVETLMAKPSLAAFQRPLTPRNHKGFGYMEFLPLGILDNSTYIKNDTLIIKAFVTSNTGL